MTTSERTATNQADVDLDLSVAVRHELIEHVLGLDAESVVDRVILPLRAELRPPDTGVETTAQYIRRLCEENQGLRATITNARAIAEMWDNRAGREILESLLTAPKTSTAPAVHPTAQIEPVGDFGPLSGYCCDICRANERD